MNKKNISDKELEKQWKPVSDCSTLVGETVKSYMKPFIETNMMEHEQTRKLVKQSHEYMKIANNNRTHIFFLWLSVVALLTITLFLPTCTSYGV